MLGLIITDNSCNYGKQDQMLLTNKSFVPIFLVQPSPDLLTNNFPVNTVKTFQDFHTYVHVSIVRSTTCIYYSNMYKHVAFFTF